MMNQQVYSKTARAAHQFMERLREGHFSTGDLDVIIDTAISNELPRARMGTDIFFGHVIEPLSDTFLARDRKTLQKVLAYLVSRIRILPQARQLHERLDQWGLRDETDLLERIERISSDKKFDAQLIGKVKKIFIPSRVTLGADVLLSSPVIEKMKQTFPGAEIVFLGSEKNGRLLKGNQPMVRVHPLKYHRRGVLLNRFLIWLHVIHALENEIGQLGQGEDYIIVNTDSRLLQSGLLPMIPPVKEDKRYFSWKPSVNRDAWNGTSQAEDLVQWLETTFGAGQKMESIYPKINFLAEDDAFANKVYERLNSPGKPFIVSMSLGVGGNQEKRVRSGSEIVSRFEIGLIRRLLSDGVTLILDKGNGKEEFDQADAIIRDAAGMGFEILEVKEKKPGSIGARFREAVSGNIRLIAFQGGVSTFAALINISDIFIGYDSLGQHMAGAVGRDIIAIFAGYHSDLFPQRWKPLGSGTIRLVKARLGPFTLERQDDLVSEVFELYKSLRMTQTRKHVNTKTKSKSTT
jgi:ADP-heptose:LPS heptosyltransferase